ncbi:hypothetical protein L198_03170 [Cryptococcus wingfieldii CBS 7118]|uniref:GST C-terminal domain-containing protein n=1 Tax=Cryptococcus wingfieldii CBS 7118 TaxID=1295528 RepID=A0A1E3JJ62_9TREE|nr:hypothetical protein L198_03170 [Cryptococcus wingfieldii CBS 7118]ODO00843.1 hypothetical protein L198_03170 [Cryptococcus wingfieldii CBS 7118]
MSLPKAILYSWPSSVWSTVPRLCLIEKGYAEDEYVVKYVNICTIPTLVVPTLETTGDDVDTRYRSLRDTVSICDFLDQARGANTSQTSSERPAPALAPATIEGTLHRDPQKSLSDLYLAKTLSDQVIELIHLPAVDPNFIAISAVNEAELKEKASDGPGKALSARKDALTKYLAEARQVVAGSTVAPKEGSTTFDQRIVQFLEEKLRTNEEVWKIYHGESASETLDLFYEVSQKAWKERLPEAFSQLENLIKGPYVLGDHLSLADLHAVSWMTRIVSIAGGLPDANGLDSIERKTGANLGEKTKKFWELWIERESFKQVLVPASSAFQEMK